MAAINNLVLGLLRDVSFETLPDARRTTGQSPSGSLSGPYAQPWYNPGLR